MHRRRLVTTLLALLAALSMAAPVRALEPWRVVVRVSGKVESKQAGGDWSPIWRSRLLSDGDYARTLADSRGVVRLADQSEFTIGADTEVEMTRFSLTPEGRTVVFNLKFGKIRARVAKALGKQSKFEVKTPNGVLAARGTEFFVEQRPPATGEAGRVADAAPGPGAGAPNGDTIVRVFEGRVDFTAGNRTVSFGPGDFGFVTPSGVINFNPPEMHPNTPAGGTGTLGGDAGGPGPDGGPDADLSQAPAPDGGGDPTGGAPPPANTLSGDARQPGGSTGDARVDSGGTSGTTTPPPIYSPTATPRTGTLPIIIQP